MADTLLIHEVIQVFVEILIVARKVKEELLQRGQVFLRVIHDGVHLAAVASREHDRLVDALVVVEVREALPDGLLRYREALTYLHGGRLMIQSQNQ